MLTIILIFDILLILTILTLMFQPHLLYRSLSPGLGSWIPPPQILLLAVSAWRTRGRSRCRWVTKIYKFIDESLDL